ncbi:MAG: DUF1549 domain-containing protein [Pirellulales bacterium]
MTLGGRCFGWALLVSTVSLAAAIVAATAQAAGPGSQQTAQRVDRLLADELFKSDSNLAPRTDDATFLRRVWLDIVGDIPTPEHVTAFLLDSSGDKRERIVRELLNNEQYGQNWARYWRDVIFSRKLEERAEVAANAMVADLTRELNDNVGWDKIATAFITATGDVKENGAAAIQMAQDGRTEETTAEMSRIFLGIQIQCAQCHDHKTDRWKREQFHELAAFFPRVGVSPVQTPTRNSFEVVVNPGVERRRGNPDNANRRGRPEHFMPDLERPTADGTLMQPKFFLTNKSLPLGTPDAVRRGTLAEWISDNPWFATALVNRMWGELVGEGFYEPIDDMGPDRTPNGKKAVEFLSRSFAESDFDVKWLFRVICATEAYQRESRPRRGSEGTPFAANVAQPLRSDQMFNALLTAADLTEADVSPAGRGRRGGPAGPRRGGGSGRQQFDATFGYDPSDPRDTVSGSIPQALAMMNGPRINQVARAQTRGTALGQLVDEITDDEALVVELYLRTLSRQPTDVEMKTSLAFRRTVAQRPAAFEDVFWALLNTAEFSHRR